MEKIIGKYWVYFVAVMLLGVYFWGAKQMYFHQDDLDWFILANQPLSVVIKAPIGDHVNYLWRFLISLEWNLFGLNFIPYLTVSMLLHVGVIMLLYKITWETTRRKDLSIIVAMMFAINTNWNEIILWISGQTISITVIFVLLAMLSIWKRKGEFIWLLFSSWTSALAIGVVMSSILVFKKLWWKSGIVLVFLGLIYSMWGSDGTKIVYSLEWAIKVIEVASLMLINTVVGRILIPFDKYEILRIGVVLVVGMVLSWRYRSKLVEIWSDQWSKFLLIQLIIYNLIVAVGRAQFGVGIMRAERYAYLGVALFLLIGARIFRTTKIDRWGWIIVLLVIWQNIGFYRRASDYIVRPQQLKRLIEQIEKGEDRSEGGQYLPRFVLNDARLKYGDLYGLMIR